VISAGGALRQRPRAAHHEPLSCSSSAQATALPCEGLTVQVGKRLAHPVMRQSISDRAISPRNRHRQRVGKIAQRAMGGHTRHSQGTIDDALRCRVPAWKCGQGGALDTSGQRGRPTGARNPAGASHIVTFPMVNDDGPRPLDLRLPCVTPTQWSKVCAADGGSSLPAQRYPICGIAGPGTFPRPGKAAARLSRRSEPRGGRSISSIKERSRQSRHRRGGSAWIAPGRRFKNPGAGQRHYQWRSRLGPIVF